MATCPNCGRKLHWADWRPECPGCGVNLNYYKANEKLLADSERAEIEHAKSQPRIDRVKGATIGQKKGIIRMILFLIPAVALLLPIFSITVSGNKTSYNAIDIYNLFSSLDTGKVLSDISPIVIAVVLCVLPAALGLIFMILQITAGKKKGLTRNIVYSCISLTLAIASLVCIIVFSGKPAGDYSKLLLNKAEYAYEHGGQSDVDGAVQKTRDLFSDKAVDKGLLEKAVKNGKAALKDAAKRGYDDDQKAALEAALNKAEEVLLKEDASIGDVRGAAGDVNSAVAVYNDLETAVKYASLIKNDGSISEGSYTSLAEKTAEAQEMLDTLASGGVIVDPKKNNGAADKTPEEIKEGTDEKLASTLVDLNGKMKSLVDISVIESQNAKLSESVENGSAANADVKATVGIGIILFILILVAQLVFNIIIKKNGYEIKYTQCLIGGLPSEEYFRYVEEGMSKDEIYRKMLIALAEIQDEAEKALKESENDG